MAKYIFDQALAQITSANFSNSILGPTSAIDLDWLENARGILNLQKVSPYDRFGIVSTKFAEALQNDTRVSSKLFYGILNGGESYRIFRNICGFKWLAEYPDLPTTGNLTAFFGDKRSLITATRQIKFSNAAEQLNVNEIMQFYPIADPESKIQMTGVAWQQPGTGDVYVSSAVLFGNAGGSNGGATGAVTDNAGLRVTSQ